MPEPRELSPNEQLIIGAKVNRICGLAPVEFNSEEHLADVEHIVNALDPLLISSHEYRLMTSNVGQSQNSMMGQTEHGQVRIPNQNQTNEATSLGSNDFRVGLFVVNKLVLPDYSSLTFEHFWDRSNLHLRLNQPLFRTLFRYKPGAEGLVIVKVVRGVDLPMKLGPIEALGRRVTVFGLIRQTTEMWPKLGKENRSLAGWGVSWGKTS